MESSWEPTDDKGGVADLHNTTANEFLQQMYYMCQHNAIKKGLSCEEMGTAVGFKGIEGEPLVMMLVPYLPESELVMEEVPACLN